MMGKNRPKATEEQAIKFLEMFVRIKTEKAGRKNTTRGISDTTSRNLRTLIDEPPKGRGYKWEEVEAVIAECVTNKYVIENNLDTPDHVLSEKNFDRYFNAVVAKQQKEAEQKEVKENGESAIAPKVMGRLASEVAQPNYIDPEQLEEAKKLYTESLEAGEWKGDTLNSMSIGALFTNDFTVAEKIGFKKQAEVLQLQEHKEDSSRTGTGTMRQTFVRMARRHVNNVMFELVVVEAVNRKIKEPWAREKE